MKRLALVTALVAFTTACPGDSPTEPAGDIAGTWILQAVNGDPVPADWDGLVVTAGQVVIQANGNFTYSESYEGEASDAVSGVCTETSTAGTWTCDPTEQAGEGPQENGTAVFNGNSMTLSVPNPTTVRTYQRN